MPLPCLQKRCFWIMPVKHNTPVTHDSGGRRTGEQDAYLKARWRFRPAARQRPAEDDVISILALGQRISHDAAVSGASSCAGFRLSSMPWWCTWCSVPASAVAILMSSMSSSSGLAAGGVRLVPPPARAHRSRAALAGLFNAVCALAAS